MPQSLWTTWMWTKDKLTLMNPCIYGERAFHGHKTGGGSVPAPHFRHILRHREVGGWKICGNRTPLRLLLYLLISFQPQLRLQQMQVLLQLLGTAVHHLQLHTGTFTDTVFQQGWELRFYVLCGTESVRMFRVSQWVVVMPFTQDSLIRLCPMEHLAPTAAVNWPTQPGLTQCREKQCGWS